MTIDKEEHRTFLLEILNKIQFTGNRKELKENLRLVDELVEAIEKAKLEEVKDGDSTKRMASTKD